MRNQYINITLPLSKFTTDMSNKLLKVLM